MKWRKPAPFQRFLSNANLKNLAIRTAGNRLVTLFQHPAYAPVNHYRTDHIDRQVKPSSFPFPSDPLLQFRRHLSARRAGAQHQHADVLPPFKPPPYCRCQKFQNIVFFHFAPLDTLFLRSSVRAYRLLSFAQKAKTATKKPPQKAVELYLNIDKYLNTV